MVRICDGVGGESEGGCGVLLICGSIHHEAKVAMGTTTSKRRDGASIGVDFLGEQGDGCIGWLAADFGEGWIWKRKGRDSRRHGQRTTCERSDDKEIN